ncbi:MAG: hypothetical protein R3F37_13650 [Candidatus Competibacteraceae bacterium]
MNPTEAGQTDSAFLDIAANLLAIMLIVTLFSLITVRYGADRSDNPLATINPNLPFVEPRRDLFPPFSRFFLVAAERVVEWDQAAVVTALQAEPEALSGNTRQGRYRLLPEALTVYDIDTHTLQFHPDIAGLAESVAPFDETGEAALVERLTQDYAASRRLPVFIVYPSGMETFARLYPRLQDSGLRFRWFARAEGAPLDIGRHPAQFTDYAIYW